MALLLMLLLQRRLESLAVQATPCGEGCPGREPLRHHLRPLMIVMLHSRPRCEVKTLCVWVVLCNSNRGSEQGQRQRPSYTTECAATERAAYQLLAMTLLCCWVGAVGQATCAGSILMMMMMMSRKEPHL